MPLHTYIHAMRHICAARFNRSNTYILPIRALGPRGRGGTGVMHRARLLKSNLYY